MTGVVSKEWLDWFKLIVPHIITLCNHAEQKSISVRTTRQTLWCMGYNRRRAHHVPLKNLRLQRRLHVLTF